MYQTFQHKIFIANLDRQQTTEQTLIYSIIKIHDFPLEDKKDPQYLNGKLSN